MDRRTQKSKQAIMHALIELMAKKNFEKITINEIANKANVNRGTIYLYYTDKYDLLDKCVETSLTHLSAYLLDTPCLPNDSTHDSAKISIERTFEYMENHAFLYTTLLKNNGVSTFRNRLAKMMHQILDMKINMPIHNQEVSKDILVEFLVSGLVGVLEWWFANSMPYSAKDITEQLCKLLERNSIDFS